MHKYNPIGAYGVTFNKRAIFIYKTKTACEGYFVRKKNWNSIINNSEFNDVVSLFKSQLDSNYKNQVKVKMLAHKTKKLKKHFKRNDYQNVMTMTFVDKK